MLRRVGELDPEAMGRPSDIKQGNHIVVLVFWEDHWYRGQMGGEGQRQVSR